MSDTPKVSSEYAVLYKCAFEYLLLRTLGSNATRDDVWQINKGDI